jgi:hypothetical protein
MNRSASGAIQVYKDGTSLGCRRASGLSSGHRFSAPLPPPDIQREAGIERLHLGHHRTVCGGETVLDGGTSAWWLRDDRSLTAAMKITVTAKAAQISNFAAVDPVIARRPWLVSVNGTAALPRRGKSSIRLSAIALESASVHRPPGNCAINEANLCVAISFGRSDSSAASFQGSTFDRASAERTLSGISPACAPIGA